MLGTQSKAVCMTGKHPTSSATLPRPRSFLKFKGAQFTKVLTKPALAELRIPACHRWAASLPLTWDQLWSRNTEGLPRSCEASRTGSQTHPAPGASCWQPNSRSLPRADLGKHLTVPQETAPGRDSPHPTLVPDPTRTPQGNMPPTAAGSPVLPEVCLGACSRLPHSGIWTPLYNLPKEEATQSPHRQQPEPQQNYSGEETRAYKFRSTFLLPRQQQGPAGGTGVLSDSCISM